MKIYLITGIDAFDESLIADCSLFFPIWRKEQMMSYKHLKGKKQNALAYLLLIYALREEGIFSEMPEFSYNEHGKPFLKNYPGWKFNLSHTKDAVCCVISEEDVGIDIEEVRGYKEMLAAYSCNEEEMKLLDRSCDKAGCFYRLWTRKEAAFKLVGSGITKNIRDILSRDDIKVESERIDDIWMSVAVYRR